MEHTLNTLKLIQVYCRIRLKMNITFEIRISKDQEDPLDLFNVALMVVDI